MTECVSDLAPPRETYSVLSVRYDVNQARVVSESPIEEWRSCVEDVVVHCVKCCGEVKKDEK